MMNAADMNHIAEALDRMAKAKGLNTPQFPAERAQDYWNCFVTAYFAHDFPKPPMDLHETKVFDNLLEQCLKVRGVASLTTPDQLNVISAYHRILVLNFFDIATKGAFFQRAASAGSVTVVPIRDPADLPPLGHIDFQRMARELVAKSKSGLPARLTGDDCNDLAKEVISAGLRIAAHGMDRSTPAILFRTVALDAVAKGLAAAWSAGTFGTVSFFIEEDRLRTWRNTADYDDFETLYLREGRRVVLIAPEETAQQQGGYRCRLATLHPRFPDTFELHTTDAKAKDG